MCIHRARDPGNLHDHTDLDAAALDAIVSLLVRLFVAHLLLGLVVLLLLARVPAVLHLLLLARVSSRHRVGSSVVRLAVLGMLRLVLLAVVEGRHLRRPMASTGLQLDVDPALVVLRVVLQPQLAADLLHARLDLLHVVGAVVALADDDVQVRLPALLRVADALLQDLLGLLHELPVQVDRVAVHLAHGVVLAEDELGRLPVVLVGFGGVLLALLRQLVRLAAVAALVRLLGACGEVLVLALLFAGEVAQAVVFLLGVAGRAVIEGWNRVLGLRADVGMCRHCVATHHGLPNAVCET